MESLRTVPLFVPGDRSDFFEKAADSTADTLILDLEDAVPAEKKESSRLQVEQALAQLASGNKELVVRVNALSSPWGTEDLSMVRRCSGINAVLIPKAEPAEVQLTEQLLGEADIRIICQIETARGLQLAYETLISSPRVTGTMLGAEDLAAEMNFRRTFTGEEIEHARHTLVVAAYAAAVQPIDTPYLKIDDPDGLRSDTIRAKEIGFTAKAALSPRQIPVIREIFRPCAEELEEARRILEAAEEARKRGRGVVTLDGAMIDAPVVNRARRVIELAREVEGDDR